MAVMVDAVRDTRRDYRTCGEGGKDFRAETPLCFRACLHVHFAENLGKKFHPVIVIHCKELVVVPLGYLMADSLTVDNGGHPVFPLGLCRLNDYLAHFDFPPVFLFPIPSLVFIQKLEVTPVHCRTDISLYRFLLLLQRGFHWHKSLLLLPLALFQILLYFGMQTDSDALIAVESLHRHFVGKVSPDNAVQQFQTFLYGLLLDGCGNQCPHFLFRQVIDHIGLDAFRLHGQRLLFRIHDKTVRGKALRPFLVGEIDRRGYKLLVRPCRFLAAWTADHRRDSRLQVLQHIPLLYGLLLLMPLVIESVTA